MDSLTRLIETYRVYYCIECGKCTGACPLAQVDQDFSPRLLAKKAVEEGLESAYVREKAWACLTCGLCHERCPQGIPFADFIRTIRPLYPGPAGRPPLSHGGALQTLMRMQAVAPLNQNRLDWITPDVRISSEGEVLYFVGCLPYFETFFHDMGIALTTIAVDTVRILNTVGVEPVVLADERCCGHDLLWTGDRPSFSRLRDRNMRSFERAGISTIVTACGECSHTLKHLYPEEGEPFPFEVVHLSTFLETRGFRADKDLDGVATFQDPCRLGRFQGVYEAPRLVLSSALELREMRHAGPGAWCCGNAAWLGCDRYSKQMQIERLWEAKATGSDMIVTACPKCRVHLTCAMMDVNRLGDQRMTIKDFANVMAETLG